MALLLETERGRGKPPKRRIWLGMSFSDAEVGAVVRDGLNAVRREHFDVEDDYGYVGRTYKKEEVNEANLSRTVRRWSLQGGRLQRVAVQQRLVYAKLK